MRIRIHITKGQRVALRMVAEGAPDAERLAVRDFTASFDMADPIGWLEARMAQWPRGEFPRASLHAVLRKLSSSIQGQVEPDLASGQGQPDLTGHCIIVETIDADMAREANRPDAAGRLGIIECHDGRRGKLCAVQCDLPDDVGIEDAARGIARTYGARYAGVVK